MAAELVTRWYGAFVVERGRPVREARFPADLDTLKDRLRERRGGNAAPEELALVEGGSAPGLTTRDRRLVGPTVGLASARTDRPSLPDPELALLRELLLSEAESALRGAWDPSVHLEEAVRAIEEVDRMRNVLGERLASWTDRDPSVAGSDGPEDAAIGSGSGWPTLDPALTDARSALGRSYRELGELRANLEAAVEGAARRRMPNLSALLGPSLAARMVARAGGLDRLARFPSSTVQVLGAEKAFFDHLRRGSRPPRHGLLFLHPRVQGAPRKQRGRLARALAGKAAIAARLDAAGRPTDPGLGAAFERRSKEITRPKAGGDARRAGSRAPLHRAAEDG